MSSLNLVWVRLQFSTGQTARIWVRAAAYIKPARPLAGDPRPVAEARRNHSRRRTPLLRAGAGLGDAELEPAEHTVLRVPRAREGSLRRKGRSRPGRLIDRDIRTQSYLVRDGAGNYRFAHKSIMEFFVARKLAPLLGEGKAPGVPPDRCRGEFRTLSAQAGLPLRRTHGRRHGLRAAGAVPLWLGGRGQFASGRHPAR